MVNTLTPQDFELMAEKAGITMAELLRRAEVVPSVFQRWKRGDSTIGLRNYLRICNAAEASITSPPRKPRKSHIPSDVEVA